MILHSKVLQLALSEVIKKSDKNSYNIIILIIILIISNVSYKMFVMDINLKRLLIAA